MRPVARALSLLLVLVPPVEAAEIRLTVPDAMLRRALRETCLICPCEAPTLALRVREAANCAIDKLADLGRWHFRRLDDLGADVTVIEGDPP